MSERLCDEAVPGTDGIEEPCERPAVGWRIDEENQPYPVCVIHHRWPYADEWVAAEAALGRVRAVEGQLRDRREFYWKQYLAAKGGVSEALRQGRFDAYDDATRRIHAALDGGTE